jgi:hypothetical protein
LPTGSVPKRNGKLRPDKERKERGENRNETPGNYCLPLIVGQKDSLLRNLQNRSLVVSPPHSRYGRDGSV